MMVSSKNSEIVQASLPVRGCDKSASNSHKSNENQDQSGNGRCTIDQLAPDLNSADISHEQEIRVSTGQRQTNNMQSERACYFAVKQQITLKSKPRPDTSMFGKTCDGKLVPCVKKVKTS
jgi:RecA-family ATPase